jgi:hypothetical protein
LEEEEEKDQHRSLSYSSWLMVLLLVLLPRIAANEEPVVLGNWYTRMAAFPNDRDTESLIAVAVAVAPDDSVILTLWR